MRTVCAALAVVGLSVAACGSADDKAGDAAGAGTADAAAGAPPHIVGSCDALPSTGTWEEITPIPGDNPALANNPAWQKTKQDIKCGAVAHRGAFAMSTHTRPSTAGSGPI